MDIVGRKRQEHALAGLTLNAVLTHETAKKHHQARTLFDIIQDDKGGKGSKMPWKSFKPKIKIRKSGADWKSTVPIPACDVVVEHTENETITHTTSNRFADVPNIEDSDSDLEEPADNSSSLTTTRSIMMRGNSIRETNREPFRMMMRETVIDEDESDEVLENEEKEEEDGDDEIAAMVGIPKEPIVKMSLMSLLSECGFDREEDNESEEDGEEEEEDGGVGEYSNCCVCMVRHRGTPFVPCAHTFCRLCSKELFVQRSSCPICTNYILEFLHFF